MDTQANPNGRRRRRRKKPNLTKGAPVEPIFIAARRPDSPRLEKPTRRMKAASARPRGVVPPVNLGAKPNELAGSNEGADSSTKLETGERDEPTLRKERRQARIVVRSTDAPDETEKNRLRLLSRVMASEGRAAITRAVDVYFAEGFSLPREQEAQLKLLEHFDENRAESAIKTLIDLLQSEPPRQLPVLRQRLRRLEDHADDAGIRDLAASLRRQLPA